MVSLAKLGSWFLLLIVSYTLISLENRLKVMNVLAGETASQLPARREAA
jgi:uncharacterized membrane protein YoaT (DUF817 family)